MRLSTASIGCKLTISRGIAKRARSAPSRRNVTRHSDRRSPTQRELIGGIRNANANFDQAMLPWEIFYGVFAGIGGPFAVKQSVAEREALVTESAGTTRTRLIDELIGKGVKVAPQSVIEIQRVNGKTIWLETGSSPAGLRHIVGEHGAEFAQRGFSELEIPNVLFAALQRNNVVGYQGRGAGRPIYEFDYRGQIYQLQSRLETTGSLWARISDDNQ
ncbi:hypothetical protein Rleg10DRAFT_7026 [Rhizobium leguminosarum bv. trifolii WSM2012]|nr:hypothetical protein Rleg10DRAFT_7026 [Rhizobium leguminosarum bv. trifolii WSM2012]